MDYVKLSKQIHETAQDKGWWDEERPTDRIFALVASELYEALEADRNSKYAARSQFKDELKRQKEWGNLNKDFSSVFKMCIKDSLEDELADAFIRCLDYLYYRHREHFQILDVNITWEEDFASNIFGINKALCRYDIAEAAGAILSLANHMDIDLEWHVKQKMKYNDRRAYKHGGKKY